MTTAAELKGWFDQGVTQGSKWMIILVDTWDYDNYPVYFTDPVELYKRYDNAGNMQRVMEVYDLSLPFQAEGRCFQLPPRPVDGAVKG